MRVDDRACSHLSLEQQRFLSRDRPSRLPLPHYPGLSGRFLMHGAQVRPLQISQSRYPRLALVSSQALQRPAQPGHPLRWVVWWSS